MSAIRVAFIHGLEGHPEGRKVVSLRTQGFDVSAADMHMSLWSLKRSNSGARQLLRLPETRAAAALGLAGLYGSVRRGSPLGAVASAAGFVTWFTARRTELMGSALANSFDTCVQIQREALEAESPDVLVGSSWGGAVAARLLLDGVWTGPTILLAPAIARVRTWTDRGHPIDDARLRELADRQRIVVFHDPSDDTVPFKDSVSLAGDSKIDLRSVSAGGHRLLELLDRGELADTIRALAGARG